MKEQSYKDRRDESRGMKENVDVMGHASKVHKCDAFAAEKADMGRMDWKKGGMRGNPAQAWDYQY